MKRIIKEKNAFLAATEKGNALILTLGLFNLLAALGIYFSLQLAHLTTLNNMDADLEVVKIKVIRRIKNEFYDQCCEDFVFEEKGITVNAVYEDSQCTLDFSGKVHFQMIIQYDEVYLCIASIEYVYDE